MTQLTTCLNQIEVWHDWYEDTLDCFAEEAKGKGIDIALERDGTPAISFSGFWSQGDGLAFDADINWPAFFDAHPGLKTEYMNWYLVLSANPDYMQTSVYRSNRGNNMYISSEGDPEVTIEEGFFAGVDATTIEFEDGFEDAVFSACADEADRIYMALEKEYEAQWDDEAYQVKERWLEEHGALLHTLLWPLSTTGIFTRADIFHEDIDFDDLDTLDLLKHVPGLGWVLSKKGLRVLA